MQLTKEIKFPHKILKHIFLNFIIFFSFEKNIFYGKILRKLDKRLKLN